MFFGESVEVREIISRFRVGLLKHELQQSVACKLFADNDMFASISESLSGRCCGEQLFIRLECSLAAAAALGHARHRANK